MPSAHRPGEATEATRRSLAASSADLPMDDTQDFEDVRRGFVGRSEQRQVTASDGRVVWDLDAYAFLDGPAPDTAHPSLWRQGQLLTEDGLFEVTPGIYQARGFDLSVISFVEGDEGVIVIDPLISRETAAAAWALYREHRGDRPVTAMIYTHSHIDHFGGAKGILTQAEVDERGIPVLAPEGFADHAVSENVFAGTAMARRAGYMYGAALEKGPAGQIGAGLGMTTSTGEPTFLPPTVDVTHTGQEMTLDGVRIEFQLTPGTEAPAEMNFFFPDHAALCTAENTSHTLHNILTLRGAQVRDARAWSEYLTETIDLWGDRLELVFASHHWPTWGRERAVGFLEMQRDMYAYIHDQTLRMMNQGLTGAEIAEALEVPPALAQQWHTHGYYGSISHNVKAIYQRYMGWYDGNPAHLWGHPPVEVARRYVDAMGGADAAVAVAERAFDEGDLRWAVEVLNHVLFAEEDHARARELQADAFEQLGFGSENGTWRDVYLSGATELRDGIFGTPTTTGSDDFLHALTVRQVLTGLSLRVDGPQAWDEQLTLCWTVTDEGTTYITELRNGVLVIRTADAPVPGATTMTLRRTTLIDLLTQRVDAATAFGDGSIQLEGDAADLGRLVGVLGSTDPAFPIVTP
ncbi:alkyl sulfatase dimerization domain-containing protein [Iamia majanohamensis]|uniref:Linear primary-alkylsulfatase n=1 Tax=Iamia majanohamensis TaxID=467976 RepID=A0AAF0BUD4_9ACTN|nr:alkyl sulfatase dimerization domain-containing protein [Iamia majanohamensis]WCO65725.1 alkyl sulfatase dimerization domain-containing protein [Iamia majanohamensis]